MGTRTFAQVATNGSGEKIAVQQLTDGANGNVDRQEILIADPNTVAAVAPVQNAAPASTDYGLTVRQAGDGLVVLNGAPVASATTLATQDTSGGYGWFQLQLAGTFSFTITIEISNDNTNWQGIPLYAVGSGLPTSATTGGTSSTTPFWGYCKGRYIRVRCSAFTSSASGAVTFVLRSTPPPLEFINVLIQNSPLTVSAQPGGATGSLSFTSARITASATSNTSTNVKASAGNLYSVVLSNTSASAKFFKFYNKATAPTVGTDTPIWTMLLPAGTTTVINLDMNPMRFATGIGYGITGAVADNDTTALVANDVVGILNYA